MRAMVLFGPRPLHTIRCGGAFLILVLGAVACSSTTGPRSGVTLLVVNGTCTVGPCPSLHVLGYPQNQPNTPGGLWRFELGVLAAPSACLTFPRSATFRIIGPSDTTIITWTSADSMELGSLDSLAFPFAALPSTGEFVPASAPGWTVTLPGGTRASPTQPCTP
jgi:hypothetical protein